MTDNDSITIHLAEHKHGCAFDLLIFLREFDGYGSALVCVGCTGQENRLATLSFGDYLLFQVAQTRYEVRLIEAKPTRSDPQAVIRISKLPPNPPACHEEK